MNSEMTELQSQVARISAELAKAKGTIRTLEARKPGRPPAALWLGIVVTIVALTSWGGYAQTPSTQGAQIADLIKRVTDLEKLRVQVTALEQSEKKLEQSEKKLEQSKNKVTAPFEVVDSAGRTIVHVGREENGSGGLWTMSPAGKVMATIGNNADGNAILGASSADGGQEAVMGIGSLGMGYVEINNNRNPIVRLGKVTQDAAPGLRVWDAGGMLAGSLVSAPKGGRLQVYANDGASALIGIPEDGRSIGMRVNNKDGKTIASVSRNNDSPTGAVSIADRDGKMVATMKMVGNDPVVAVFHGDKTVAAFGAETDGRGYFTAYFGDKEAAMLTTSDENPGAGRLTLNAPSGAWAVRAGYSGTHGDVAVGGYGAEGKAASHSLWASAVVGSLAK